jgi:diguanylate cyclase (GGDEF)-like protein
MVLRAVPNEVAQLRQIVETQRRINAATLHGDALLSVVAESAQRITGGDGGVVELAEDDDMVYRAATGTIAQAVGTRLKIDGSLSGLCVRTGDVLRCDDTETDARVDRGACRRLGIRSMICVPLIDHGVPVGVLKVVSGRPDAFGLHDVHTLELLAGFIATSISNASAHRHETDKALHDPLTGLPNRLLLADRLDHALMVAQRSRTEVAAVYVDLDGFKAVNDRHGHNAGDKLLRAVADELTRTLRGSDTVARLGGDEFVMICEEADRRAEPVIAARIRNAVQVAALAAGADSAVSASIGIAWSGDHPTPAALLEAADDAMYRNKRAR